MTLEVAHERVVAADVVDRDIHALRRAPVAAPVQQAGLGEREGAGAGPGEQRSGGGKRAERGRQPHGGRGRERREHAWLVERPERGHRDDVGTAEIV